MIRTEALTKYYGERCAVRELSVTIEDREIVGFLGKNGAGKTTTLRMLAGLLAPSSGRIEIDGQSMDATEGDFRWRIGFLPDKPPLYDQMRIRDYLAFAAQLRGYPQARLQGRLSQVLELCGLGPRQDDVIGTLSAGYKQRVGIAQAIVHEPALVILDEPIASLDPVQLKDVRALIRDLKAEHTVLLSSHNLREVHQTCDRLLVIREGELVFTGTEAEASQRAHAQGAWRLTLRGAASAVQATLDALPAVTGWQTLSTPEEDVHIVKVQLTDADPEPVARGVVEAGLGLRGLAPAEDQLEGVFAELTEVAA